MKYDAIVVGAGASGLTAAAYLAKYGRSILLIEKQNHVGGLVNSFRREGFTFDGGIRALENAGVLFPMLKNLGINIEFVKNHVSLGIEDQVIFVKEDPDLSAYENLLKTLYPDSSEEISAIIQDIKQITRYMDIQYGIDNPIFLDIKQDRDYFIRKVFPWMFKYALTVPKVGKRDMPVIPYLRRFTKNQKLLDIIAQHFFTDTPAYFALSYFRLFNDYYYPKGGTGVFIQKLTEFIEGHGGEIRTGSAVTSINLQEKTITTQDNTEIGYDQLLWTADQKTLYQMIDSASVTDQNTINAIEEKKAFLAEMSGNDSIFSLYLQTNLDQVYFSRISSEHFFYTPSREGQSAAGTPPVNGTWEEIKTWLAKFYALTTYEIAIPVLRDNTLAPPGKTGLIISTLFDYVFTKYIYEQGWEDLFRREVAELMINTLDKTIYPGLAGAIEAQFTSTPMTIQKMTGSTDGAITGWSFLNTPVPAESRLIKIANAVKTPLPDVHQAGQWTYSPSGLPVSLITGKLAADRIEKRLK